jgi:transcriptional regulator with XRE-family HTH domain
MSDNNLKKIAAQFLRARMAKDLTQAEVAKKAHMGLNRYAIIERGEAENVTYKKLKDIATVLGVTIQIMPNN